jgi:hypothetical protein
MIVSQDVDRGRVKNAWPIIIPESIDTMYLNGYNLPMYTIQQTHKFSQWLTKLKDMRARIAIARRLDRA